MSNAPQTLCGGCLSPTVRPKSPPKKPVSSRGCPCGANAHSATATGELCPNSAREPTTARAAPPAAGIRTGHRYTNTIQRRMAHPSSADRRRCGWAGQGTTRKVRCWFSFALLHGVNGIASTRDLVLSLGKIDLQSQSLTGLICARDAVDGP